MVWREAIGLHRRAGNFARALELLEQGLRVAPAQFADMAGPPTSCAGRPAR